MFEKYKLIQNFYFKKNYIFAENINFAGEFSWENRAAKILSYVDESCRPQVYN